MISVSNVSMRYGAKVLFDEVSTAFTQGKRYGLTGPNGAGKSTFMKLLTGELEPQKGTVVRPRKLGVLSQDQFAFDQYRVVDTVIMGNKRLWAALEERDAIYARPELTDADGMKLGELEGIVGEEDGYTAESDAAILRSLPGVGRAVAARLLVDATALLAARDYGALRSQSGIAPVTRRSGKRRVVLMRRACSGRLRQAMHHWAFASMQRDPHSREIYAAARTRGQTHGRALRGLGDRLLRVLIAMLKSRTPYDPERIRRAA